MLLIGIDPGTTGAVAFYDTLKETLELVDMPTMKLMSTTKRSRTSISGPMLAAEFEGRVFFTKKAHAFVERVHALPGQGVSSTFTFGMAFGVALGVLAGLNIPTTLIVPQQWQRVCRVPRGKDGSRQRAAELFPFNSQDFKRVKDHNRADAALIALAGANFLNISKDRVKA